MEEERERGRIVESRTAGGDNKGRSTVQYANEWNTDSWHTTMYVNMD